MDLFCPSKLVRAQALLNLEKYRPRLHNLDCNIDHLNKCSNYLQFALYDCMV